MCGRCIINSCCQQSRLKCMKEWSRGIKSQSFAAWVMKISITQNLDNLKALHIVYHVHNCYLHEISFQTSVRFLKVTMCILLDVLTQLPPESCKDDGETMCADVPLHGSLWFWIPLPKEPSIQACPLLCLFLVLACSPLSEKLHHFFSHSRFIDSCHTWCGL